MRRGTSTSNFGAGGRESHDASGFYRRFSPPEVSTDDTVLTPAPVAEPFVHGDARDMARGRRRLGGAGGHLAAVLRREGSTRRSSSARAVPASLPRIPRHARRTCSPNAGASSSLAGASRSTWPTSGRKPYRSLAADVVRILAGRPRPAAPRRDRLAEGRGRRRVVRLGLVPQRGQPGAARRHRAGRSSPARAASTGPARSATAPRRGPAPREHRRRRGLHGAHPRHVVDPAESARRVGHPAPFPVELPAQLIGLYTFRGRPRARSVHGQRLDRGRRRRARPPLRAATTSTPDYVELARRRVSEALSEPSPSDTAGSPGVEAETALRFAETALRDAGFDHRRRGTGASPGPAWWSISPPLTTPGRFGGSISAAPTPRTAAG